MKLNPDRRQFLGATALVAISFADAKIAAAQTARQTLSTINAYVAIGADGAVVIQSAHSEIGQGIGTTWAAIIADELEADWSRVRYEFSPVGAPYQHPIYKWQFTGNSESIRSYHAMIRQAGAAAREMLVRAASMQLRATPEVLVARDSSVTHPATGRSLTYAALAPAAARLPVPINPRVKPESEWRLVGKGRSLLRLDIPPKVRSEAVFGMDVKVPGMVYAAVKSADTIGGSIDEVNDAAAKAMPGVIAVVPLGSAVAVIAQHYWQARKALAALEVRWKPGAAAGLDDAKLEAQYEAAHVSGPWVVAESEGEAETTLSAARRKVSARYISPWLAHAPMEPMNATVSVTADGVTAWVPTQGSQMTQIVLASVLKLDPAKVTVNRTYIGGGFGRRLLADMTAQAAICSKAVGRPVKLIWHREEDFKQEVFRPMFDVTLDAALDEAGMPTALHAKLVAPTILAPVSPTPMKPGMVDGLCVEGLVESPYHWPAIKVDYHWLEVPIPTMVLRTTGHGPNNFAMESFIDELARRARKDPYQYRRALLARNPVGLAVLDRAAELAQWGAAPRGRFQGIAFGDGFGCFLCQIAELSIEDGAIRLHKITSVADPGRVLDRVNATSMIEGGVVWGLSAVLYSELSFAGGHIRERNYNGFRVASMPDVPELVTDFLEGRATIGGLAEVGPVCTPAAVCNAFAAATGKRIRRLPLARAGVHTVYGQRYA